MGRKYYDWAGAEVITAARLNSAFDASGNLDLDAATSLKTVGAAATPIKAIYLDNTATDGGAVYFDAGATEYLKSNAAGTTLTVGGFTTVDFAAATVIDFNASALSGAITLLCGANATLVDFANATAIISQADSGVSDAAPNGLVLESNSTGATVARPLSSYAGAAAAGDTGEGIGGYFQATSARNAANTAVYAFAGAGTTNYSFYGAAGWMFCALASVPAHANNAAAAGGGIAVGGFYRTNADPSVLCIRSA